MVSRTYQNILLACVALAFLVASTPSIAPTFDERFDEAKTLYSQLRFEEAANLLEKLRTDQSLIVTQKRDVLEFLGRVYLKLDQNGVARTAMTDLIQLEPPLTHPDPDHVSQDYIRLYYNVRQETCGSYISRAGCGSTNAAEELTIAVLDFDNNSVDDHDRMAPLGAGMAYTMIDHLSANSTLRLVEREHIEWLKGEIDLNQTERVDQSSALKLGKLLGAHLVVLGEYMYLGKELSLAARLIRVETGEILKSKVTRGKLDDFGKMSERLSGWLAEAVPSEDTGSDARSSAEESDGYTSNVEAILAYADGVAHYHALEFSMAETKLMRAVEIDPDWAPPKERLEMVRHEMSVAANTR